MGVCMCKCDDSRSETYAPATERTQHVFSVRHQRQQPCSSETSHSANLMQPPSNPRNVKHIDQLVLKALQSIPVFLDNDREPPESIVRLRSIADNEEGWLVVISSIINVTPVDDPFGPSVITILMDDCPLQSKETVFRLMGMYNISVDRAIREEPRSIEGNLCIVLGCIAEKFAGPNSQAIFTNNVLDYLVTCVKLKKDPIIVLYALIALEKFAETTENKLVIKSRLEEENDHILLKLEHHINDIDYAWRQVGFCSQWSLDNLFLVENRPLSYETVDMTGKNVILNANDVSQYLKISSDGLEARSDTYSFESVRCTFQINEGCWYYESQIITSGVMQIGWATRNSRFLNHEGLGIGDDLYSISFDGCRKLIWYDAVPQSLDIPPWKPGDIVGCLIDLNTLEVIFSVNENRIKPHNEIFSSATKGFFAAASFMSFQQCRFNFGSEAFVFPPKDRDFKNFNDHGVLTDVDKVLPRRIANEKLLKSTIMENSCTICCDREATCFLAPCGHGGFCSYCASLLKDCPLCRSIITDIDQQYSEDKTDKCDPPNTPLTIQRSENGNQSNIPAEDIS